jgi:cytochrome c oxidase assembly protein subunit 15
MSNIVPFETKRTCMKSGMPAAVLAIGFGTTVAMWATVYVFHVLLVDVPPPLILGIMLSCLVGGGVVAGRHVADGLWAAAGVGLVVGVLNLLVLGAALMSGPEASVPPIWLWLPGWLLGVGVFAVLGEAIGRAFSSEETRPEIDWLPVFAWVAAVATLLLITSGGLVTGLRAGLAVPDWPNSFGYNMFLYPLAKMTGGVFYEHSHRLMGALIGLTGLTLAITITAYRRSSLAVALVWLVGVCIAIQGVLGGGRVVLDSHVLAVVHGFFAQVILSGLVGVAVLLAPRPLTPDGKPWAIRGVDRVHATLLVAALLMQIMLGTVLRQFNHALMEHLSIGMLIGLLTIAVGVRSAALYPKVRAMSWGGVALLILVVVQIMLGFAALVFRTPPVDQSPTAQQLAEHAVALRPFHAALITTTHQTTAALLMATSTMVMVTSWRMVKVPRGTKIAP